MKMQHVTIQTNRFEEEIKFYENVVGLTIQRDNRPEMDLVFLANAAGETCIEIINNPDADDSGNKNISIGFHTDDIVKLCGELSADGYAVTPVIVPVPGVQFFFVTDPAGVQIQFIC